MDALDNAHRLLAAVREAPESDARWAWIAYLEVVTLNAAAGADHAGLAPPLVPVPVP